MSFTLSRNPLNGKNKIEESPTLNFFTIFFSLAICSLILRSSSSLRIRSASIRRQNRFTFLLDPGEQLRFLDLDFFEALVMLILTDWNS